MSDFLFTSKERYSFIRSVVTTILGLILIFTIADYNISYDTGKFIFSSYKSNSEIKSYQKEFQILNEKSLVSSSLNEKKNLLIEYTSLNWKLANLSMKLQKTEKGSEDFNDAVSLWGRTSSKRHELEKEIKGFEYKNTPSQKPNHSNENYEIVDVVFIFKKFLKIFSNNFDGSYPTKSI